MDIFVIFCNYDQCLQPSCQLSKFLAVFWHFWLSQATTGPVRRVDWDQSLVELTHNTRPSAGNVEQTVVIFKS